jgi:adenylate cyclase
MNKNASRLVKLTPVFILIIFFLIYFSASFCFEHRQVLKGNPFNKKITFEYPSFVITDKSCNYYVIDQAMRRVIKLDKHNNILYVIEGGKRTGETFFYAYEIAVDRNENLYILNQVLDKNGYFLDREEIIKYNSKGKFEKILYTHKYPEEVYKNKITIAQRGQLSAISVIDDLLNWYEINETGLYQNKMTLSGELHDQSIIMKYDDACLIIYSVCKSGNDIIFSTRKGEIYSIKKDLHIEKIYSSDSANSIRSTPWSVASDVNENVYFTDLGSREILSLSPKNGKNVILSKSIVAKAGYEPDSYYLCYRLTFNQENNLISSANDNNIVTVTPAGKINSYFSSGIASNKIILSRIAVWLSAVSCIVFLILGFYLFYLFIKRLGFPLILKQLFLYIPFVTVAMVAISTMIINDFSSRYQKEVINKLSQMVQMSQQIGDFDKISKITKNEDFFNSDYKYIRDRFLLAFNYNRDEWNNAYYFVIYRVINDSLYGFMYLNGAIGIYYPFNYFDDPDSVYRQAYKGKIVTELTSDNWGDWMDTIGPLYDSKGNIVALIEIGTDLYTFNEQNTQLFYKMIRGIIIILLLFIIIFVIATYILMIFANAFKRVAYENQKVNINLKNNPFGIKDEIGNPGFGFTKLSEYVLNYINEIINLNKSYHRFVPEQFLHCLQKGDVTKIQLGDQIQKNMTILFLNIKSYTSLSQNMDPKEYLDFINSYLNKIGPVIVKYHGFIEKYNDGTLIALFPHEADNAINSALSIIDKFKSINDRRSKQGQIQINAGMGIHSGSLVLGVIGEHDRIEGTIISDNVGLASRLEELSRILGTSVIVSQLAVESTRHREKFIYRYLGKIRSSGKNDSIGIFEILDAYPDDRKALRVRTKDIFESGIMLYQQKKFHEAATKFTTMLSFDKNDDASILYLSICEKYLKDENIKENWDGTLPCNEK